MLRKKATLFFLYFKLVFGIYKLAAGNTIFWKKCEKSCCLQTYLQRETAMFFFHAWGARQFKRKSILVDTNFKATWSSFSGGQKLCFVHNTEQSSYDDNDGLLLTLICELPLKNLREHLL